MGPAGLPIQSTTNDAGQSAVQAPHKPETRKPSHARNRHATNPNDLRAAYVEDSPHDDTMGWAFPNMEDEKDEKDDDDIVGGQSDTSGESILAISMERARERAVVEIPTTSDELAGRASQFRAAYNRLNGGGPEEVNDRHSYVDAYLRDSYKQMLRASSPDTQDVTDAQIENPQRPQDSPSPSESK